MNRLHHLQSTAPECLESRATCADPNRFYCNSDCRTQADRDYVEVCRLTGCNSVARLDIKLTLEGHPELFLTASDAHGLATFLLECAKT
jgi:hypothetical protein